MELEEKYWISLVKSTENKTPSSKGFTIYIKNC